MKNGLNLAYRAGFDAVVEMPDSITRFITRSSILRRLEAAKQLNSEVEYGLFAGVISDSTQIKEIVDLYYETFPQILGLKVLNDVSDIEKIYSCLHNCDYRGFLAITPRKNVRVEDRCGCDYFSVEDEISSIEDHVRMADMYNFRGALHFSHVTNPESVKMIDSLRKSVSFKISMGVTPQHLLLSSEFTQNRNKCVCANPPLRDKKSQQGLLKCLMDGRISWIETDHAECYTETQAVLSHGFPTYHIFPALVRHLKNKGISQDLLNKVTHDNFNKRFKLTIERPVPRKWDFSISNDILVDVFKELDV